MGLLGSLFGKKNTAAEDAYTQHLHTLAQNARDFWAAWQGGEARLAELDDRAFVEQGNDLLQGFCPEVALELEGHARGGDGSTLVFTAHGRTGQFAQVQALVAHAQTARYQVRAFRHGMMAGNADFAIGMDGFSLSAADIRVACTPWREVAALDMAFACDIPDHMTDHARNMAMIMLDHVVGEWDASVKIGAVDFVDTVPEGAVPLHALPPLLAEVWQGLGHTAVYPEPEWQYGMYEVEEAEDQDALTLLRNQSATALLGRADMAWCVSVTCRCSNEEELEQAYTLQDALWAAAETRQQGIGTLALSHLGQGRRTAYAATSEPLALLQQAQEWCARFGDLEAGAACEYDPSWQHYRL